MIFKILRIRIGSDSILSDQYWSRTEKFHSPLISGREFSAGSYQALVSWYCILLSRRTVCGRAGGNTPRIQK